MADERRNFACIIPAAEETLFDVAIVRGILLTGDHRAVEFDYIGRNLTLEEAARLALAAPTIPKLEFDRQEVNSRL